MSSVLSHVCPRSNNAPHPSPPNSEGQRACIAEQDMASQIPNSKARFHGNMYLGIRPKSDTHGRGESDLSVLDHPMSQLAG